MLSFRGCLDGTLMVQIDAPVTPNRARPPRLACALYVAQTVSFIDREMTQRLAVLQVGSADRGTFGHMLKANFGH